MGLNGYAVVVAPRADLDPFAPFSAWTVNDSPTWFRAYNAVKHDRERHFEQATLEATIQAVAACYSMLYARFGQHALLRPFAPEMTRVLQLEEFPHWPIHQRYLAGSGGEASAVPYFGA